MKAPQEAGASHTIEDHQVAVIPQQEAALVTALLLAGEELAAPMRSHDRAKNRAVHAEAQPRLYTAETDFGWMLDVARHAATRLAEVPGRGRLAAALTDALGDGETLSLLFNRFFPRRRGAMYLGQDGKPLLTRRQIEILREASKGLSNTDIAERLFLSPRTVTTHLEKIHRRLGVSKTVQAVAKAVALGYLDLDAVGFVREASNRSLRDFSVLHAFLAEAGRDERVLGAPSFRRLAQFGLLLTLSAVAAAMTLRCDDVADIPQVGIVVQITPQGEILRAFGSDRLRMAQSLCIAPDVAAREGFTPGNIYVVNDGLPQRGLNTSEVVEYTADGREVGAFYGATDVLTRLSGATTLTFDGRGRLLVSSGPLTEAVLAFRRGGRTVERFWPGRAAQIGTTPRGLVLMAVASFGNERILVLNSDGEVLGEHQPSGGGIAYSGIAALPNGTIVTCHEEGGDGVVEAVGVDDGTVVRRVVRGVGGAQLYVDTQGRIFVPARSSNAIVVLDALQGPCRTFSLPGIYPRCVVGGEGGTLWVAGQVA